MSCGDFPVGRSRGYAKEIMGASRLLYPDDSEESEDDIVDTDESENGLVLIHLRNEVTHPMMVDTCGERCAQLDDFSWLRPTEE